jgi:two-component system sensor histidine kinase KdpD
MARGRLRIYLGAAPGVGKTYSMLDEGFRRRERGTDVVVGLVETHGRASTAAQIRDLEVIPRREIEHRGVRFEEMDTDAILARGPQVALVDELAHTNVPGSRNEKRWQDVEELLEAGIDVVSTVNIQHLESLNDVIEEITGIRQAETIPDEVVRRAEQIELEDMTPEALRRRMAHGNIYPAERIDAALANFFRTGNLGALRELALLWVADRVEEALEEYRKTHGIERPWETRERIVVALAGVPDGDRLVRRAARIAARVHGDLIGVHVRPSDGLSAGSAELLAQQRRLIEQLGGTYREVAGYDIGHALVEAARSLNATQIVLGATSRSRIRELLHGSVIARVVRESGIGIDVHVISHRTGAEVPSPPRRRRRQALSRLRQVLGLGLAAAGAPLLTWILTQTRDHVDLGSVLLIYVLLVVGVAAVGGIWPATATAIACFLLANWYFTPPVHTLSISGFDDVLALAAFLGLAGAMSSFVWLSARRSAEGTQLRAEATALSTLAGSPSVDEVLERLRRTFGLEGVTLWHRNGSGWRAEASAGVECPRRDGSGLAVDGGHELALAGRAVPAEDRRVLDTFISELAAAIHVEELEREASAVGRLSAASDLRMAVLMAVSHDLRPPLAGIKASVTSLLQDDVEWNDAEQRAFLTTIDEEAARLNELNGNLLDMSRIKSGALRIDAAPVGLHEIVPAALRSLGPRADRVRVDIPETLSRIEVDPGLLERSVANLVANAIAHSPEGRPVRVYAGAVGRWVELRVADHGTGVPEADREGVFEPFQRLGDPQQGEGVGLGLVVARGFVEAMGGQVELEDTPGGGLTVVVRLRAAA